MKSPWLVIVGFLSAVFSPNAALSSDSNSIRATIGINSSFILEKGNDRVSESSRFPFGVSLGARRDVWSFRWEYSSFRTADGNQVVSVAREHEFLLGWFGYDFSLSEIEAPRWSGLLGIGVGVQRINSETTLNQNLELSRGPWRGTFAASVGLRARWTPRFSFVPELRYISAENFDFIEKTKDARWGVFFGLELEIL